MLILGLQGLTTAVLFNFVEQGGSDVFLVDEN